MPIDTGELYNTNADFREYVDRYCKNYNEGRSISTEEALTHEIVKRYAEYLRTRDK